MNPPVALGDGDVVDAGLTAAHQPVFGELPQFVAVTGRIIADELSQRAWIAAREPQVWIG